MYSLDKSVANVLDRALLAEQPLRIDSGSNNTKILRANITSSNEAAISVNLSGGGLVISPSNTLVYGVDSTNASVVSGEITDGVLNLVPSQNLVTSVVFSNQALNGKIENNVLTIGGSIGASFEVWPNTQTFKAGDYIKYKGVEYTLLKAGIFELPSADILCPINKNLNGIDSSNVFYFVANDIQLETAGRWKSIKSKNGRDSYLTGLFGKLENYDGRANASAVRLIGGQVMASSAYSPFSHVGDYTLIYAAKIFEGLPGAKILKLTRSMNVGSTVRTDLDEVLINVSEKKSNSVDICGLKVPFHFGLPNMITIRVSGEGRIGGQEFEVRINNTNIVHAITSPLSDVSNLCGQLIVNGSDPITASQLTQEISALIGISCPLSDNDLATMYEYLALDMNFSSPPLNLLVKFRYDFVSTAVHVFSDTNSALIASYLPSSPENSLLSSGLSADATSLFSVSSALPTLDATSSRLILSASAPMRTGQLPTRHVTFPLTIRVCAAGFSSGGVFLLGRLHASEDGVDELVIVYENASGKVSIVNNGVVVYGISIGLAGLTGASLDVYVSLDVEYVDGAEYTKVFVRANGEDVCVGALWKYEVAQQFKHFQIGGSAPGVVASGTFVPSEVRIFDEALRPEECV